MNGFKYYGLILVTGNITMIASAGANTACDFHGAIMGVGTFDATGISNLTGPAFSMTIQQNACLVQGSLTMVPLKVLSFREVTQ